MMSRFMLNLRQSAGLHETMFVTTAIPTTLDFGNDTLDVISDSYDSGQSAGVRAAEDKTFEHRTRIYSPSHDSPVHDQEIELADLDRT